MTPGRDLRSTECTFLQLYLFTFNSINFYFTSQHMETRLSTPQQNTHFWYTKILSSPFSLSLYPLLSHPLSEVCVLVYVCVVHVCVCV